MLIDRAIQTTVWYNFPVFKDLLAFIINGSFKSVSGEICNIFVVFINMIVNQISLTEKVIMVNTIRLLLYRCI